MISFNIKSQKSWSNIEEHIRIHHAIVTNDVTNDQQTTMTNIHRLIHDVVQCWRNHEA